MKTTLAERLREFIIYTGLTDKDFAMRFGASKQEISNWTRGVRMNLGKMGDMLEAFPELNGHWLLGGHSEMLISSVKNGKEVQNVEHDKESQIIIDKLKDQIIELQKEKIEWLMEKNRIEKVN